LALAAFLGGCDHAGRSEWERKNDQTLELPAQDPAPPPPAFPARDTLLPVEVRASSAFQYFVDGATLSVDLKTTIVRYTLVARSSSGVDNVSYEAIRCASAEYRVYYLGQADHTWGGRPGNWALIAQSRQVHLRPLYRDYFCPQSNPIRDADEGRMALRQGGHPWAKGFSGDALRGQ
jgi:hypothetical protein